MNRLSLCLCVVFLAGCPDDPVEGGGGTCDGGGQSCTTSAACPLNYVCNATCCEPFDGCNAESCATGEFCDEDFSCKSIAQKCNEVGGCECHILNSAGQLEADGTPKITLAGTGERQLEAVLAIDKGTQLPGASFTFTFAGNGFAAIGTDDLLVGDGTAGSGTVTATADGGIIPAVTCTADVENLGPAPTTSTRVYVFNQITGAPVDDATIVFTDEDTGDELGNRVDTSPDGIANSTVDIDVPFNVTVFKAGYNYMSVVNLPTTARDLALPLAQRNEPPTVGGFTGQLDSDHYEDLRGSSDILAGIVGGSVPLTSILNFDLATIVGDVGADCDLEPNKCYAITTEQLPILTEDVLAPLPGGLVLGFGENMLKGHYDTVGVPGRRYAWALGGGVKIGDLGPLIEIFAPLFTEQNCACNTTNSCDAGCDCDISCVEFGAVFDGVVPLLSQFASGAKGNIPLKEVSQATWEGYLSCNDTEPCVYGQDRVDAAGNFPMLDSGAGQYGLLELRELLSVFTNYDAPSLPDDPDLTGNETMEGMIVLAGVNATGFGFVPLGIGAGLDCTEGDCLDRVGNAANFDGEVNGSKVCFWNSDATRNRCDDIEGLPNSAASEGRLDAGHLGLFHAPAHSGLEGQEWMTIALALPLSSFTSENFTIRATAYVLREEPADGTDSLPNSWMDFPAMPDNTFLRTYEIASGHGDLHWITVGSPADDDTQSTRWNVFYASGGGKFIAPDVPGGFVDPFEPAPLGQVDITPGFVDLTHVAFDLGATPPSLTDLALNNGSTLSDITKSLTAFSVQSRELDAEN